MAHKIQGYDEMSEMNQTRPFCSEHEHKWRHTNTCSICIIESLKRERDELKAKFEVVNNAVYDISIDNSKLLIDMYNLKSELKRKDEALQKLANLEVQEIILKANDSVSAVILIVKEIAKQAIEGDGSKSQFLTE